MHKESNIDKRSLERVFEQRESKKRLIVNVLEMEKAEEYVKIEHLSSKKYRVYKDDKHEDFIIIRNKDEACTYILKEVVAPKSTREALKNQEIAKKFYERTLRNQQKNAI